MKRADPQQIIHTALQVAGLLLGLLTVATLCAVLLVVRPARATDSTPWPEVPSPPKARVEWIAESMRVNGIPMRVLHFESSVSRADIVAYYRAYWSGGYPTKPSVRTANDATLVGQMHGPYYMMVKVKDAAGGHSEGLISVSRVLGSKVERSPGEVPVMPGARVTLVVESNDPGRRSRQVLISNPAAVPSVVHYYQAALSNAGWRQIQYNDTPGEAQRPPGSFFVFLREHSEMQLSVVASADGRGSILSATLVTKDTGPQEF
jgi:hypothetical protein